MLFEHSFNTLGCTLSTPTVLYGFRFLSFVWIISSSNVGSGHLVLVLFSQIGMFESSWQKTEPKELFKILAIWDPSVIIFSFLSFKSSYWILDFSFTIHISVNHFWVTPWLRCQFSFELFYRLFDFNFHLFIKCFEFLS
jgi:hypothetical protein